MIISECKCGCKYNKEQWKTLDYVGPIEHPKDETGPAVSLELRNCPCGSTISADKTILDVS